VANLASDAIIKHMLLETRKVTEKNIESYMNPEPGFQSGPGDSTNADKMAPFLLVTKSSPPLGGLRKTLRRCPAGAKIARRNASCTWDVTHERALSPADSFGGKTPAGA